MLPVESWAVFYADGSTFTSSDGSWAEAPPFGVQAVVYYHVGDRRTLHTEANDMSRYVYQGPEGYTGIKLGLWLDADGFYRILDRAGGAQP